jgi:hypothetical protein
MLVYQRVNIIDCLSYAIFCNLLSSSFFGLPKDSEVATGTLLRISAIARVVITIGYKEDNPILRVNTPPTNRRSFWVLYHGYLILDGRD